MKKFALVTLVVFFIIIFGVNFFTKKLIEYNNDVLLHEAMAHFETMLNTRSWNAGYGGVYVKRLPGIEPNPYLKENTLKIDKNESLIKINPAWMTRQIAEISNKSNSYIYKITSLNPINPDNKPDQFETEALKFFESNPSSNYFYRTEKERDNRSYFDFMGVLKTEDACLNCHAFQGYKTGDVRGGIRISIPSDAIEKENDLIYLINYLFIFVFLLIAALILFIAKRHFHSLALQEKAEQALVKHERQLSTIFSNLPGVVYRSTFDTRKMLFLSSGCKNLTGYDADELIDGAAISYRDLINNEDIEKIFQDIASAIKNGKKFEIEYRIKTKSKKELWVWEQGEAVGENMIEGYITDITEVKEARIKESEQKQLLTQQTRMAEMGEMMSAIAHQWRQPLNVLGLQIQDIADAYKFNELDDDYIKNSSDIMLKQIAHMNDTIEVFRNFFKPDKEKTVFELKDALDEVAKIVFAQLKDNDISLSINYNDPDDSTAHKVFGKPNELKQVVLIMINNAKDAIKELKTTQTGTIKGAISIEITRLSENILLEVSDNGGGISQSILPKLFTPYLTTKGEKGTGIGLRIAKKVIETNFGGTISARNITDASGKTTGALFTVTLKSAEAGS